MSRALVIVQSDRDRQKACAWVNQAPWGTRIEFKATKRTTDQNAKMWAALTDIAEQVVWYGQKLKASDWKLILMASLRQEMRIVPNIDGTGFVNLGVSTSDLSKMEMSNLIELILMFGAKHGVKFHDTESQTDAA
jgi:hypothetical protein